MKADLYWRRLVDAYRRRQARRATATRVAKAQLADDLLDTLSPSVLMTTGYLRRRRVVRRYVRVRVR